MRQKRSPTNSSTASKPCSTTPFSTRRCASTRYRATSAAPSPARCRSPRPTGCSRSSAAKPGSTPTPGAKPPPCARAGRRTAHRARRRRPADPLPLPGTRQRRRPSDYEPWCLAYLHAVDTAAEDWFDELDDEEEVEWLDERLFPLMVLTGEAEAAAREHGETWPEGKELEELRQQAQEDLARAVSRFTCSGTPSAAPAPSAATAARSAATTPVPVAR